MARSQVTVIIPAHNEQAGLPATLASLAAQDVQPAQVIVVADNCTDDTARIAREAGVMVIEAQGGSKAKAQNVALPLVRTDLVLPLDADTVLSRDYIAKVEAVFVDEQVAVAAGCVLTLTQDSTWSRARQMEYLQSFHLYRPIQQAWDSVVVCAGCCSIFRTADLVASGGFPEGTLTEDIDYTLAQHRAGRRAVYVHDAVAYAAEPDSLAFTRTQLKRWKSGHAQSVRKHYLPLVRRRPLVALWLTVQAVEVALAPLVLLLPLVALLGGSLTAMLPWWALTEVLTLWVPVAIGCRKRGFSFLSALRAYPSWWCLKAVNFEADMRHWVPEVLGLRKPFAVYEMGH